MGDFLISARSLKRLLDSGVPPLLLDVRNAAAVTASGLAVPGALWRDPALVADWGREPARGRTVILYCVHGHEVSRRVGAALRAQGLDARILEGGFEGWRAAGGAVVPVPEAETAR